MRRERTRIRPGCVDRWASTSSSSHARRAEAGTVGGTTGATSRGVVARARRGRDTVPGGSRHTPVGHEAAGRSPRCRSCARRAKVAWPSASFPDDDCSSTGAGLCRGGPRLTRTAPRRVPITVVEVDDALPAACRPGPDPRGSGPRGEQRGRPTTTTAALMPAQLHDTSRAWLLDGCGPRPCADPPPPQGQPIGRPSAAASAADSARARPISAPRGGLHPWPRADPKTSTASITMLTPPPSGRHAARLRRSGGVRSLLHPHDRRRVQIGIGEQHADERQVGDRV